MSGLFQDGLIFLCSLIAGPTALLSIKDFSSFYSSNSLYAHAVPSARNALPAHLTRYLILQVSAQRSLPQEPPRTNQLSHQHPKPPFIPMIPEWDGVCLPT